jgi:hypothetical protein
MKTLRRAPVLWLSAGLVFLGGRSASAQLPKGEVATTYAWENNQGFKYPIGWTASPAVRIVPWLAVVGEIAGNYDLERVPDLPGFTYRNQRYTISNHTFAAGPRAVATVSPRVALFGQVLFGVMRIAGDPDRPIGWSHSSLLVQPGGGVTMRLSRWIAARGTLDIPLVREDGEAFKWPLPYGYYRLVRVGAGIALGFGNP